MSKEHFFPWGYHEIRLLNVHTLDFCLFLNVYCSYSFLSLHLHLRNVLSVTVNSILSLLLTPLIGLTLVCSLPTPLVRFDL